MQSAKTKAEILQQKEKLATSYSELLNEFSSVDLRHVGNYELGKLIGKGSFGKVYLAKHTLTNGSKVVLKASKKDDTNLVREIHHHRQFIHPHIARLYEVIVTESIVWLVLEYCPGDELYHYLLRAGALPIEKAQKIFTQLVGAVAYIHSKSCVHRDLKLENVLLDKHENVKLCDFGFTREYEGKANYLQTFCGTVCYSAPEMLRGEKYAGEKVDVWSLGIILYALLRGELPFDEDDDQATKAKIIKDDPVYPDTFPDSAKTLLTKLLAKRPLHRPTLADILADPFLSEYAPHQQAVLKLSQPAPFTTPLEKLTLERMKSAGVDIDKVIEHVLSQRCDTLAGWWAILIEKEQKKAAKREKKRKDKEAELKLLRRLSGASSRLDKLTPTLEDVPENMQEQSGTVTIGRHRSLSRGRSQRRSTTQILVTDLPKLPEGSVVQTPGDVTPPPPVEKDLIRSRSGSRPPIPPKERKRRSSTLQMVTMNPELLGPANGVTKRRKGRRRDNQFLKSLTQLKEWFIDTTKISKSPRKLESSAIATVNLDGKSQPEPGGSTPPGHNRDISGASAATRSSYGATLSPVISSGHPAIRLDTARVRPRSSVSPITPRSSYRHSSGGLKGRTSTSSSVSSVRSLHLHQSKASSISSNSIETVNSPSHSIGRSPHSSIKVLPVTPTMSHFPSNARFVLDRDATLSSTRESISASPRTSMMNLRHSPAAPDAFTGAATNGGSGVMFARRKKTPFKGPSMNLNPIFTSHSSVGPGQASPAIFSGSSRHREDSAEHLNAGLKDLTFRRDGKQNHDKPRKSQIIEEEDEEEVQENEGALIDDDDEEIEEVDAFEPIDVDRRRGERVHSIVIWDDPVVELEKGGIGSRSKTPEPIQGIRHLRIGSTDGVVESNGSRGGNSPL